MYIRTYVFVSFKTTPVIRIQILIDPTFNTLFTSSASYINFKKNKTYRNLNFQFCQVNDINLSFIRVATLQPR